MIGKTLATFALVSAAVLGSSAPAMAATAPTGEVSHGSIAVQDWNRHCQWEWNRWQHRWVWDCDRYYEHYQWRWHDHDRRWHWDNDRDWNEHHGHR